jgi:hypothetical protein
METLFKETIGKVVGDILSQDVQSQPVINNTTTPTEQINS